MSGFLGALLLAAACGAQASDLLSAWQAARSHDPVFAAERARWAAGQTKLRQAAALSMPQVSLSGSAGIAGSDRNTTGAQFSAPGFGSANDAAFRTRTEIGPAVSLSVNATQSLYNEERDANSRQLRTEAQLADARLRQKEQELMLRTAQAYFAVVIAEDALDALRAEKEASRQAVETASAKFEEGATPVTDRDEARSRFDDITAREVLVANELAVRRLALADLTGIPTRELSKLAAASALERYAPAPVAQWLQTATRDSPLIRMQELGQDIAGHELRKFHALISPSIDVFARIADERLQGSSGYGPTTHVTSSMRVVGLQVTVPLFTGGMRSAKRDEAAALLDKAGHDVAAVRQEVLRHTQAAWLTAQSNLARVHAQEQALRSSRSRLDATQTGHEVGARTMVDLMNAQSDFHEARRKLNEAKYQVLLDHVQLAASAGALSETTLQQVNATLSAIPQESP